MLQPFRDNIWIADGPTTESFGFRYLTRMVVIRLTGGALFIWSPVALSDALRADIDGLGPVGAIVAPNALHHLFLADWQAAYPHARFYAAPGLRARRKDIAFDSDLGDVPEPVWATDIDQVVVRGNRITTEVVFFHRASRTAIFTDLIQHFGPGWFSGWRAIVARLDLMTAAEPAVPRKFRMAFTDRRAARIAIERIFDWPSEAVLMAHGPPVETDARRYLRRTFRWLTK
jgi:hypothetical protein